MILTVTLNPAVDVTVFGGPFVPHGTNRGGLMDVDPGGKGNNAARAARLLGADVIATGLSGGFTGGFVEKGLNEEAIGTRFLPIDMQSRITVAWVESESGRETKIVPAGPPVAPETGIKFIHHFEELIKQTRFSIVALCGSLPPGLPDNYYAELTAVAARYGVPVFLDTSGPALREGIAAGPLAVKPNRDEAAELTGSDECGAIKEYLERLSSRIPYVFMTMGPAGAWCFHNGERLVVHPAGGVGVNPVGAGDAFVGGFAAAWDRYGNNGELLLSWAAASGTAAALSKRLLYEPEVFRRVLGEQVIATVE